MAKSLQRKKKSLIEESRFALQNILRNRTRGKISFVRFRKMLDEVKRLRDKNVDEPTKGKVAELFGMET